MNQNQTIKELKNRILALDIVQAVGKYVPLKRTGAEHLGLCPFHNEKSPSFSVNKTKGIFKCFGCGASGDIIEFVMKFKKVGFMEAIFELAKNYNIPVLLDNRKNDDFAKNLSKDFKQILPGIMIPTLKSYQGNKLACFLADLHGWNDIIPLFQKYGVGTSKKGLTIFWMIDQFQRIRSLKLMKYQENGKRDKSFTDYKPRDEKGYPLYTVNHGYQPCLFGEHLLFDADKDAIIAIVESEKTALIASLMLPRINERSVVWLAAGGMNGLTDAKIWVLRGLRIMLVPDFSWLSRACWGLEPMRRKEGKIDKTGEPDPTYVSAATKLLRMQCDVSFFNPCPEKEDNSDLADLLLEMGIDKPGATGELVKPDFERLILDI